MQFYPGYNMQPPMYNFQPQNQYQTPFTVRGNTLSGRIVDDINNIAAQEIPMDGSEAVFINQNGKEIYTKKWNANGTISTKCFKECLDNKPKERKSDSFSDDLLMSLYERFEKLEERIDGYFGKTKATDVKTESTDSE